MAGTERLICEEIDGPTIEIDGRSPARLNVTVIPRYCTYGESIDLDESQVLRVCETLLDWLSFAHGHRDPDA